jgi:hypothetical protein
MSTGNRVIPVASAGTVLFSTPFDAVPFVVATPFTTSTGFAHTVHITNVTTTGFSYSNIRVASGGTLQGSIEPFHYIALTL